MKIFILRKNYSYYFGIISVILHLFLLSCSLFSEDIRYPNVPVYEDNSLLPYKILRKDDKKFKKIMGNYFFSKIPTSFISSKFSIYLLSEEEIKRVEKSNIKFEKIPKSAPFKYFDINYSKHQKIKFKNLDDLKFGYKDQRQNELFLKAISKKYKDKAEYFELGKTRLGRGIPAIRITSPKPSDYKIPILFTGAHHGNELISTEHCFDIIYNLLNDYGKYEPYLENIVVWIVPIVNPDGSYFFWNNTIDMGRKNGYLPQGIKENDITRGVDLNRNYPFKWNSGQRKASSTNVYSAFFRGQSPASEPETQAMIRLAKQERFLFAMSFHSYATSILFPYTIENTLNPKPDYAKDLAERLVKFAKSFRVKKEYKVQKNLYPVDGTDQDYYYNEFGTNAFILESSHQNVDFKIVKFVLDGFKEAWENLLYEFFKKYKIILKIQDEFGNPVEAIIEIEEIKYFENEKFSSHPESGIYARMFLEEGEFTFLISKKGFKSERKILKAGNSLTPIIVKLIKL